MKLITLLSQCTLDMPLKHSSWEVDVYVNGDEDWGQEIAEEICYWNVYVRPSLLTVWKMLSARWMASWTLSLNWWLLHVAHVGIGSFATEADMKWICHSYCFFLLYRLKNVSNSREYQETTWIHDDSWRQYSHRIQVKEQNCTFYPVLNQLNSPPHLSALSWPWPEDSCHAKHTSTKNKTLDQTWAWSVTSAHWKLLLEKMSILTTNYWHVKHGVLPQAH